MVFASGAVLKGHKAVRCDSCDMWIHNECLFIAETQYEIVNNTNCTWICPKCEFFNFSDSFFGEQVNLETENRFVPLTKEKKDRSSPCGTNKSSFISGLKFISMNINSIRGKKTGIAGFPRLSSATCCSYPRNQNRQFCCNFRTLPGNLPI